MPGDMARKLVYLVGIDKVKFRRPVIPGDRLDMEARLGRVRRNIGWVSVEATVEGKLACSGELMFSIGGDASSTIYDATILRQ
jgi:3-hydroxyacyl-[acyl-carrier-protein] dehydratase